MSDARFAAVGPEQLNEIKEAQYSTSTMYNDSSCSPNKSYSCSSLENGFIVRQNGNLLTGHKNIDKNHNA